MYKLLVRPLLFSFDPEWVHYFTLNTLKLLNKIPFSSWLFRKIYSYQNSSLEKELFGIKFKNPVGLAAGFDKNGKYIKEMSNLGFGFIEIGTITPKPQPGNPKKRLFRVQNDLAIINRLGINNDGNILCAERLKKNNSDVVIGGNIGKNTATSNENADTDYIQNFEILHQYVDYFVLNVSCPNVSNFTKLQDVEFLKKLVPQLKKINSTKPKKKPILIKISPDLNQDQLDETIDLVRSENLDGIIATNTTTSRNNLKTNNSKIEKIGNGGLSGEPLKNKSNEVIRYISKKTNGNLPIIGVGGIMNPKDALDKIEAGADLIQLYTGFIYEGPSIVKKINQYLSKKS
ncbi:MAG: quinone-dependent dihydroorotate dehydrogenase [Flavobacteriales bacterium]